MLSLFAFVTPVNQLMNSKLYMWDESQLRVSVKAAAV